MRPLARHLGFVTLVLGACALMGAAPKKVPSARPAKAGNQATSARATAAVPAKTGAKAKSTPAAKNAPVAVRSKAAPAAAAMRIFRDPDAGTPIGVPTGAVIDYVEPIVEEVGVPVLNRKADGSLEMILNGSGQDYTTVTLAKDGTRHIRCDQGHDHSARAIKSAKATPPPSAQPEER